MSVILVREPVKKSVEYSTLWGRGPDWVILHQKKNKLCWISSNIQYLCCVSSYSWNVLFDI